VGNRVFVAGAALDRAWLAKRDDPKNAEELAHQTLAYSHAKSARLLTADAVELLDAVASDTESWLEAGRLLAAASSVRITWGVVMAPSERARFIAERDRR
jgi:hypothetical protein